jgi:hypothetical protein
MSTEEHYVLQGSQVGVVPTHTLCGDSVAIWVDDHAYCVAVLTPATTTPLTPLQARALAALLIVAAEKKERRR